MTETHTLTATMVGRVNYSSTGQQVLWELSRLIAPLDPWDFDDSGSRKPYRTRHIVTSYIAFAPDHGGPETFVFPAAPDGQITDWGELAGSSRGEVSHEDAIAGFLAAHNQED